MYATLINVIYTGCGQKKTYHDKNLIFSQTDRKFKTNFSTLIRDIYALISIKYYWKFSMKRTMRLIWNESFNFAIYQLKSSVKQCYKQVGFIKYLPSTIFKIYYVILCVIYDFSLRTVVLTWWWFHFPTWRRTSSLGKTDSSLAVVTSSIRTLGRL